MGLIHVEFERPRHGWLVSRLSAGGSVLEIAASATPRDSAGDLAGALALILKGGPEVKVSLNEEPTGYDLRFTAEARGVKLRVTASRERGGSRNPATELLVVAGDRRDVCLPFWRALRRLESSMSPEQYEADWGHPFPAAKVREIAALARQAEGQTKGRR